MGTATGSGSCVSTQKAATTPSCQWVALTHLERTEKVFHGSCPLKGLPESDISPTLLIESHSRCMQGMRGFFNSFLVCMIAFWKVGWLTF